MSVNRLMIIRPVHFLFSPPLGGQQLLVCSLTSASARQKYFIFVLWDCTVLYCTVLYCRLLFTVRSLQQGAEIGRSKARDITTPSLCSYSKWDIFHYGLCSSPHWNVESIQLFISHRESLFTKNFIHSLVVVKSFMKPFYSKVEQMIR